MNTLDPKIMSDWQIAEAAEENMKPLYQLARDLGLAYGEMLPMGEKLAKLDYKKILERLRFAPTGRYIDVTAITPTPLGEGKTTTTIGLVQGFGKLGKRAVGTIRQPSGGPTFNIKGSAAGGGLSQCIPLVPFSLRLTGDIECVTSAHNLAMVALTACMQHERNYDDEKSKKVGLKRLNIDPSNIQWKWAIDFCAQALRNITIGKGGKMDGFEMESCAQISVSSEVMAILAVAKNLADMQKRIRRIVLAYDKTGKEITTADFEVDGAMTAWMVDALNPNLLQTIEGQPILVHAGPFANISIGQSSIIADLVATKLSDYVITESGFGADIGYEKFWNLKCRISGLKPHAVVIVATVRALKMHGGGPSVKPGIPLSVEYTQENLELLEKGCENLIAHIEIVRKSGIRPIVCINQFKTDTTAELALVRKIAQDNGAEAAVSDHWSKGGEGAIELAEKVAAAAQEERDFDYLYSLDMPLKERIELIAANIYGAGSVDYDEIALKKIKMIDENPKLRQLGTCMVKTHLSLSHNPNLKGRPRGWQLPIRDVLIYKGAGYVVPIAGDIKLMPGTGSNPAFRRINVDIKTGRVRGLF
jgi:formyltetrahydrofolate synthetase